MNAVKSSRASESKAARSEGECVFMVQTAHKCSYMATVQAAIFLPVKMRLVDT